MEPLRLVLATRNPGKVRELAALLEGLPVDLVPCPEEAPEVDEDAPTLAGNAEKKARALHAFTGLPALADDTGLEVDALEGRPGVHSARFAGAHASDADNRVHLLAALAGQPNRAARFRTVLAFVDAAGALRLFEGVCAGTILDHERGEGGFGYDRLFVPDGHAETFAEMDRAAKNAISHRGRALAAFVAGLAAPPQPSPLERVRTACLALPRVTEKVSWSEPTWRVDGRVFAMFAAAQNHHGAGSDAVWCAAPPGAQAVLVEAAPDRLFVPPYVGPKGWIGVRLAHASEDELAVHLGRAHEHVARRPS